MRYDVRAEKTCSVRVNITCELAILFCVVSNKDVILSKYAKIVKCYVIVFAYKILGMQIGIFIREYFL